MKKNINKKIDSKTINKIFPVAFALVLLFNVIFINNIFATSANGMWESAGNWFKDTRVDQNGYAVGVSEISFNVVEQFMDIVNYVGTTIIIIATMFLGVKYMFGSVDGKADVKESMITLLVACVFFFGWQYLSTVIIDVTTGELIVAKTSDRSYKDMFGRILAIVITIVKVAAIAGVIYVGVRYIFSGATGKADLKGRSGYFIIGIILTFCSVSVLTMIANILKDVL